MIRTCPTCSKVYDDALCFTFCPHEPFISEETARRKDAAFKLMGKRLRMKGSTNSPAFISFIDGNGYIHLDNGETFQPDEVEVVE